MQGDVDAEGDDREIRGSAVDHSPTLVRVEADAEQVEHIFRDQDAAEGDADHGDEEQRIDQKIEAGLMKQFLEEFRADVDDPFPVKEQVGDDGGGEGDAQPFMDAVAGNAWVGGCQEGGENGQVENEICFG